LKEQYICVERLYKKEKITHYLLYKYENGSLVKMLLATQQVRDILRDRNSKVEGLQLTLDDRIKETENGIVQRIALICSGFKLGMINHVNGVTYTTSNNSSIRMDKNSLSIDVKDPQTGEHLGNIDTSNSHYDTIREASRIFQLIQSRNYNNEYRVNGIAVS